MSDFETYVLFQNGLLVLVTSAALIVQGSALRTAVRSIQVLSEQVLAQQDGNIQNALVARADLLMRDLARLDPRNGLSEQKRIEEITKELEKTKEELNSRIHIGRS